MNRELTLVTGRTALQGRHLHHGKTDLEYLQAVSELEMNPEDIGALGLADGQPALVSSAAGEARVRVKAAELPNGIVFLAMGPVANSLTSQESEGTGMPLLKGIPVRVLPLGNRESSQ